MDEYREVMPQPLIKLPTLFLPKDLVSENLLRVTERGLFTFPSYFWLIRGTGPVTKVGLSILEAEISLAYPFKIRMQVH